MSPARCPASGPVTSPDSTCPPEGAAEPAPGSLPFLPSDITQLHTRIEAADTHLMRIVHLSEIGSSIVARIPGNWGGIDALQWVFSLLDERIAWARETLIADDERESAGASEARRQRRLLPPQSVQED